MMGSMIVASIRGPREERVSTRTEPEPRASRRSLLLGCVGLALAVIPRPAEAQQKVAPKLVQYQEKPKGTQECDGCLHFVAPSSCKMVDGKINPKGWCALFAPKPK
jgi:hypothetical protein